MGRDRQAWAAAAVVFVLVCVALVLPWALAGPFDKDGPRMLNLFNYASSPVAVIELSGDGNERTLVARLDSGQATHEYQSACYGGFYVARSLTDGHELSRTAQTGCLQDWAIKDPTEDPPRIVTFGVTNRSTWAIRVYHLAPDGAEIAVTDWVRPDEYGSAVMQRADCASGELIARRTGDVEFYRGPSICEGQWVINRFPWQRPPVPSAGPP